MGPVHLQEYIEGSDVRCHVLGDSIFAERITSSSVDYRMDPSKNNYSAIECPPNLGTKMSLATRACGLAFAGWDFKIAKSGEWYCLEVNPMPGYSIYDIRCDEAISKALISYLEEN
jgi:D-alanine-D-alanine ligase-like ATP-grasp enzyme